MQMIPFISCHLNALIRKETTRAGQPEPLRHYCEINLATLPPSGVICDHERPTNDACLTVSRYSLISAYQKKLLNRRVKCKMRKV